jgi:aminoglycoside phosphotransferase (APT) family kinase protein
MEDIAAGDLSEKHVRSLLSIIEPGSELISITVPDGSFSNFTHVVETRQTDGSIHKLIVRRYKVFGSYDRGEKARREFKTFELLKRHQVPAPEALYMDEKGDVLGLPGIVTRLVPGRLMMNVPSNPITWARRLARTLAEIHSIPCGPEEQGFLLKGNAEATWFLKDDVPPPYMQAYPGGAELWHSLRDHFPKFQATPSVLLHLDYWSGNILWHEEEISAVIDWEEAAYGDPAVDVAYAEMNICLMGLPEAAAEFLRVYQLEMGQDIQNLAFWELAAAVRPMPDPVDWSIADPAGPVGTILRKFIEAAKGKIE